jgi:hypothetical protein
MNACLSFNVAAGSTQAPHRSRRGSGSMRHRLQQASAGLGRVPRIRTPAQTLDLQPGVELVVPSSPRVDSRCHSFRASPRVRHSTNRPQHRRRSAAMPSAARSVKAPLRSSSTRPMSRRARSMRAVRLPARPNGGLVASDQKLRALPVRACARACCHRARKQAQVGRGYVCPRGASPPRVD